VTIDWPAAYARLERVRRALAGAEERSAETVARLLEQRAAALALAPTEAAALPPGESLDLLAFSQAGERYAIETAWIVEVVVPRELVPLPRVPDFLLGVVHHRGRVVPVLDLRRLLGLAAPPRGAAAPVLVVETEGRVFALRADAVTGTMRSAAGELTPMPAAAAPDRGAWFRGLADGTIVVVDLPMLARDPRIVIDDETARTRAGLEPAGSRSRGTC
jgi:purine-binding chemotaxis protein CheW